MRSVFNDTSQSHASFITHLLRLCSFLTFPCINSNCSFFTNCVSLHIYCSMSLRRPVIALLLLGLCIFYPVWALPLPWARVSESIRLKESRVILKMQAIQRESHHISVFSCVLHCYFRGTKSNVSRWYKGPSLQVWEFICHTFLKVSHH